MTESQATRQNAEGHPCPPWCVTDHSEQRHGPSAGYHGSESPLIHTPSGYVNATAYQNGFSDDEPQIAVTCLNGPAGCLMTAVRDAGFLAATVEDLAEATPEQHREFAAAIRQAAAVITGAEDPEAWAFR